MKRQSLFIILFALSAVLSYHPAAAQDCYTTYKNRGDSFMMKGNYDLAIQQYQNAKYCNYLSNDQRKTLDNLIAEVNRRKALQAKSRVIIRKF